MSDYERLKEDAVKEKERFKDNLLIYLCKYNDTFHELACLVDAKRWHDFVDKITPHIYEMYDSLTKNGIEGANLKATVLCDLLKVRLTGDEECDCLDCLKEEITSSVKEIVSKQVELIDLIRKLFEKIQSGQ